MELTSAKLSSYHAARPGMGYSGRKRKSLCHSAQKARNGSVPWGPLLGDQMHAGAPGVSSIIDSYFQLPAKGRPFHPSQYPVRFCNTFTCNIIGTALSIGHCIDP